MTPHEIQYTYMYVQVGAVPAGQKPTNKCVNGEAACQCHQGALKGVHSITFCKAQGSVMVGTD